MPDGLTNKNDCYLLTLPVELRSQILREIDLLSNGKQAFRALSRTCTFFFNQFKHELYQTITLRADARSGRSLQRITAGPRASLVKHIVFRARDPKPAWERKHDPRYRLSIPSKQVVTLLHRFPDLREFELDVDEKIDLWFSEHPEPRLYPISGHSETYRFILDETLRALGRSVHHNKARVLPKLTIRRLPPRVYKALVDHGLHTLLGDLRSFHIELMDETRQPVPLANQKFIQNLDGYFFSHLNNVRVLHVQANAGSLVGEGHGIPAIDFKNVKIPYLRKLKLEHFVLGKNTENFILRHLGTLHTVNLNNCYKDQSWSTLFLKVVGRKPSKLTRFEVSEPQIPDDNPELVSTDEDGSESEVCVVDHGYRAFPRVHVYCGHTWISHEDELDELKNGISMAAWHRLQTIVEANRQCWERFYQNRRA